MLSRAAKRLDERAKELGHLLSREMGKPLNRGIIAQFYLQTQEKIMKNDTFGAFIVGIGAAATPIGLALLGFALGRVLFP